MNMKVFQHNNIRGSQNYLPPVMSNLWCTKYYSTSSASTISFLEEPSPSSPKVGYAFKMLCWLKAVRNSEIQSNSNLFEVQKSIEFFDQKALVRTYSRSSESLCVYIKNYFCKIAKEVCQSIVETGCTSIA